MELFVKIYIFSNTYLLTKVIKGARGVFNSAHMEGTLYRFCFGSLKSANSVENLNQSNLLADKKGLHHLVQKVVWINTITYTFITLVL